MTQADISGLTGLPQSHVSALETGKYLPNKRTRLRISTLVGSKINWLTNLAQDRSHIGFALNKLLNTDEPGLPDRIKYCKQYLNELEKMINHDNN